MSDEIFSLYNHKSEYSFFLYSLIPSKVLELALATGAIVPGKQPQGKLPPRKPGDDEKIAKRLGQSTSSNDNGILPILH